MEDLESGVYKCWHHPRFWLRLHLHSHFKKLSYLCHLQDVMILTYRQHFLLEVHCTIQSSHLSSHVQYRKRGMEKLPPLFKLAFCQELSQLWIKHVYSQLVQNTLEIGFMPRPSQPWDWNSQTRWSGYLLVHGLGLELVSRIVSLRQDGRRKRFTWPFLPKDCSQTSETLAPEWHHLEGRK